MDEANGFSDSSTAIVVESWNWSTDFIFSLMLMNCCSVKSQDPMPMNWRRARSLLRVPVLWRTSF